MTYDLTEKSAWDGTPVEFYEFRLGSAVWRYTSADQPITYDGWEYSSQSIERTKIEQGNEINRVNIKITVPRNNTVANLFLAQPPGGIVSVTVRRYHRSDGDEEVKTIFPGRIIGVSWSGSHAEMECESVWSSLKANGLRRHYNIGCPYTLYGTGCLVNQLTFMTQDNVTTISGSSIDVPAADAHDDGYYRGGAVLWYGPHGAANVRWILDHTDETLELSAPIPGLAVGSMVEIYPGCDHTTSTCINRFDNIINFGGFPYLPTDNPFEVKIL